MRLARARTLALTALAVGVVSWFVLDLWQRSAHEPLPLPWTAPVGIVVCAVVILGAAREVRRWVTGRRKRRLDPLVAARIAVLSTSCGYVGAVLAGWYAAQAVVVLPTLVGERRTRFWLAVLSAVAAVGLAAAGLLAQRWCRRPPDPDEEGPARGPVPPARNPDAG